MRKKNEAGRALTTDRCNATETELTIIWNSTKGGPSVFQALRHNKFNRWDINSSSSIVFARYCVHHPEVHSQHRRTSGLFQKRFCAMAHVEMCLSNLPTELQLTIALFVDRPSLSNLARTNRHFRTLWTEYLQRESLKRFAKENDGYFEHVHCFQCKSCEKNHIWISSTEIRFYPSEPGLAPQRIVQLDTCDTCRGL